MDATVFFFVLCLQPSSSSVIAVFDFNASLNDVAPVSPILFSVGLLKTEEWIVDGFHLCIVSFVFTADTEFCECFV